MDRRRFLGLLGAAGAAAVYVPKRSYFLGPWTPTPGMGGWGQVLPQDLDPERMVRMVESGTLFIPSIWNADVLEAVQFDSVLQRRMDMQRDLMNYAQSATVMRFPQWGPLRIEHVDPRTVYPIWRDGKLTEVHVAR